MGRAAEVVMDFVKGPIKPPRLKPGRVTAVFGANRDDIMVTKLLFICGALGVTVTALALVVVGIFGLLVWLGGTEWARRSEFRSHR